MLIVILFRRFSNVDSDRRKEYGATNGVGSPDCIFHDRPGSSSALSAGLLIVCPINLFLNLEYVVQRAAATLPLAKGQDTSYGLTNRYVTNKHLNSRIQPALFILFVRC